MMSDAILFAVAFVGFFYQALLQTNSAAAALRSALQKTVSNPETAHPYYWAGFVPIGHGGPLVLSR